MTGIGLGEGLAMEYRGQPDVTRSHQMSGHGAKFGRKQEEAVAALLSHRSIEDAANAVDIAPRTLIRWLKEAGFAQAYREARREAYRQSIARLQQASSAAAATFLKLMVDPNAPAAVRLRAADLVFTHGAKAIEIEDIETRVAELERVANLNSPQGSKRL